MCTATGGSSLVCTRVLQVGTKDVAEFLSTQGEALRECVGPVVWVRLEDGYSSSTVMMGSNI